MVRRRNYNASIAAQRAWSLLTPQQKATLKKRYRQDPDKDGVPTGFDCKPYNKKKQESFLPDDAKQIRNMKSVEKGSFIASGGAGAVYSVKDAKNFVVKIPLNKTKFSQSEFQDEINLYKKGKLSKLPLFIPTKEVLINKEKGLLRPRIVPIIEKIGITPHVVASQRKVFTDQFLKDLRNKLIEISYKGYSLEDGLQLGIDKSGRPILYDLGTIRKTIVKPNPGPNMWIDPFFRNNNEWKCLLEDLHKPISKFGKIIRTPANDKKYLGIKNPVKPIKAERYAQFVPRKPNKIKYSKTHVANVIDAYDLPDYEESLPKLKTFKVNPNIDATPMTNSEYKIYKEKLKAEKQKNKKLKLSSKQPKSLQNTITKQSDKKLNLKRYNNKSIKKDLVKIPTWMKSNSTKVESPNSKNSKQVSNKSNVFRKKSSRNSK